MQIKIISWFVTKQIVEVELQCECVIVKTIIWQYISHYFFIHLTAICEEILLYYIILLKFG